VKKWTALPMTNLTTAQNRTEWKRISADSSLMPPQQPNRSRKIMNETRDVVSKHE